VGEDTVGFDIDQEVYGMNDWFSDGAMAEYCITQPTSVAPKPLRLTHVEAASVPIGALTAWQGLFDRARLQAENAYSYTAEQVRSASSRSN
jgi:NADPH:quinone reductase-like Zn-dependent oxidoreductase